jgi:hypothetical protein
VAEWVFPPLGSLPGWAERGELIGQLPLLDPPALGSLGPSLIT